MFLLGETQRASRGSCGSKLILNSRRRLTARRSIPPFPRFSHRWHWKMLVIRRAFVFD